MPENEDTKLVDAILMFFVVVLPYGMSAFAFYIMWHLVIEFAKIQ